MDAHAVFDGLAWFAAALVALALRRFMPDAFPAAAKRGTGYLAALVIGAALGAYALGSLNLWLAGLPGFARSIEGALAGAILAVELYKLRTGMRGRTAALYALPVAIGIAVGRIGCYFAGLDDFTYGTPTSLPWAHDFGDGIPRHPVQLYESGSLTLFTLAYCIALLRRDRRVLRNGFALLVLCYGVQRFALEFLKPYPALFTGLTIFQIVCLGLVFYAMTILLRDNQTNAQRI